MSIEDYSTVRMKKSRITGQAFHWHDELELIIVMQGSLDLKVGYEDLLLNDGDIMLINSDEIHSIKARDENAITISIYIDCNTVYEKYPDFYEIVAIWPYSEAFEKLKSQKNFILRSVAHIESVLEQDGNAEDLDIILDSLLKSLIYCYRLDITDPDTGVVFQINKEKKDVIYRIIKYLYSNYNHKVNLQDISEQEYLSMFYLSHSFKDITGYSFRDWLNFVRVEKAEKMLLETTTSLTDIASECGFSDVRYLNKHFSKWYKISPSKYRNLFKASFVQYESTEELGESISIKDFACIFDGAKIENSMKNSKDKKVSVNTAKPTRERLLPSWRDELWCNGMSLTRYRELKQIEDVQNWIEFTSITVDELFGLEEGKEKSSLTERETHVVLNFLLDKFEKVYLVINCGFDHLFEIEVAKNVFNSFFDFYPKGRVGQIEIRLNLIDGEEETLKSISDFIDVMEDLNIAYKRYHQYKRPTDNTGQYETNYLKKMIEGDLRLDWLFTSTGFRNNLYYFYYMLSQMSETILTQEDNLVITGNEESVQLFLHNENIRAENIGNIKYMISIQGLGGEYIVMTYLWDMAKKNGTPIVKSVDALSYLSEKERKVIDTASFPDVSMNNIDIGKECKSYQHEIIIPSTSMCLIVLKRIKNK